jgi:putative PEP-CTERM system TPR-repeat lipoprotein
MHTNTLSQRPGTFSLFLIVFVAVFLTSCGLVTNDEERLNRAQTALEEGEFRAVIIDARDVLLRDPDNVRARLLLGRVSLAVNDGATAEKELRRAIELGTPLADIAADLANSLIQQQAYQRLIDEIDVASTDDVGDVLRISEYRADAYLRVGQPVVARELYQLVLDSDSESVTAKLGVVASYVAEDNFIQARATMDEVLASHSDSAKALVASGQLHLRGRNTAGAEADFRRALDLLAGGVDPDSESRALAGLAEVLLASQEIDEVREISARLSILAPDSTGALQLAARIAYSDKDWVTAQNNLQTVLQRSPDFLPARELLGAVHLRAGNLAQAESYLASVVARTPGNSRARMMLAETRLQMRDTDQARETLGPMISEDSANSQALSLAARAEFGEGDIEGGIEYLKRAAEANPNNAELQLQLATAYITARRFDEARELLDAIDLGSADDGNLRRDLLIVTTNYYDGNVALALEEANALLATASRKGPIYNIIGNMHLSQKSYDQARQSFEAGAQLSPDNLIPQRYLAGIDLAEGKIEDARQRYLNILEIDQDASWATIGLARIAFMSEKPDEGRELLESVRLSDSSAMEPRALLVAYYLGKRDFESAESVAQEGLALDKTNAAMTHALGVSLVYQNSFDAAQESFQKALDLAPDNAEYRLNLARVQRRAGDASAAMLTLEQTGDRILAHVPSAGMLVMLKIDEGDLSGAMQLAKSLQQRYPDQAMVIAYEAEVQLAAKEYDAAIETFDRALAVKKTRSLALRAFRVRDRLAISNFDEPILAYLAERPLDTVARLTLAEAYQRRGDIDKAVQQYELTIAGDPENSAALNNLAWIYQQSGDPLAEELARRAHGLDPDNASVSDTLGWILIQSDQAEEGVKIIGEALENGGGSLEHRYHLAAGLAKVGRIEEARRNLEGILADDQQFSSRSEAEQLLSEL